LIGLRIEGNKCGGREVLVWCSRSIEKLMFEVEDLEVASPTRDAPVTFQNAKTFKSIPTIPRDRDTIIGEINLLFSSKRYQKIFGG
jgi:hypothetical protein